MTEMQYHPVIGIDLGTTYSVVAAFHIENEEPQIIENPDAPKDKQETTPSVISFENMMAKAMVGWWAKRNGANDPKNTIIEIKREMGEEFRPETLAKFNAQKIFKVGEPVKAYFGGEWLLPQEVSAFTLMRMKQIAEQKLGVPIIDAVVTVPAYFTEKQKSATREAILLAGLYPRQIIPEPTAAAYCYGVDKYDSEKNCYLVYDLGGGTFDVSIIEVEEVNVQVKATVGDPRLGGGDFDDALRDWAVRELQSRFNLDVSSNPRALALLKLKAEEVKIQLSTYEEAVMNLAELSPQNPPLLKVTRDDFEQLILEKLKKSLSYVDMAIAKANGIERENIDGILLVGGSSKIPKIRQLLLEYFQQDDDFVRSDANPDAVVARGAALLAWRYQPSPQPFDIKNPPSNEIINPELDEEDLPDPGLITEHTLGIAVQEGRFARIVDCGSALPAEKKEGGFTNGGPTNEIEVNVYQGEEDYVKNNSLIGTLRIGPMDPQPAGYHQFEVTFAIDKNGLLEMTVHHLNTGRKYQAQFDQNTAVGGKDALATIHRKLVGMYGGEKPNYDNESLHSDNTMQNRCAADNFSAAADASNTTDADFEYGEYFDQSDTVIGGNAAVQNQSASATCEAAVVDHDPSATARTATANPPTSQKTNTKVQNKPFTPDLASISVKIPAEFKQLVRRSQKQLEKQYNQSLATAFNQFAAALNSGASEDELMDLGDDLADVFDDARLSNS